MRQRNIFFAFGLMAGLVGSFGCKSTNGTTASCSSGNCATASAESSSKETKTARGSMTKDLLASDASNGSNGSKCSTCRAPSTTTSSDKTPVIAAVAAGSGCSTCSACSTCGGGKIEPIPTFVPMAGVTGEPMLQTPMLPPIANTASGIVGMVPTTLPQAVTPTQSTQQPLGPGIEMVTNGGTPITLPNGDKIVPQSTMTIRFGESNDYQTLVGQVSQFRHTWRLRFAAVESEDKLGGSVILVGGDLDQLKDGQMIRVTGSVLPGDDRANGTRYQVTRFEVLEPGR